MILPQKKLEKNSGKKKWLCDKNISSQTEILFRVQSTFIFHNRNTEWRPKWKKISMLKKSNRENYHSRKKWRIEYLDLFHTNAPFYFNTFQCSSVIIWQVFCSSINWHFRTLSNIYDGVFCETYYPKKTLFPLKSYGFLMILGKTKIN